MYIYIKQMWRYFSIFFTVLEHHLWTGNDRRDGVDGVDGI